LAVAELVSTKLIRCGAAVNSRAMGAARNLEIVTPIVANLHFRRLIEIDRECRGEAGRVGRADWEEKAFCFFAA
jgi:hypothetical protein